MGKIFALPARQLTCVLTHGWPQAVHVAADLPLTGFFFKSKYARKTSQEQNTIFARGTVSMVVTVG